jgi:thioredoxin 1
MKFTSLLRPFLITFACISFVTASLSAAEGTPALEAKTTLPRLVDLGAGKCIPCKMMKPVLDELTKEYTGQFDVVFIDVWEKKEEGEKYGIRMIPTQIFYGADGKELARHEGFFAKKDILAKWKELGVVLKEPAVAKQN